MRGGNAGALMARVAYLSGRSYRGAALARGDVPALERPDRELILAAGRARGIEFETVYWDEPDLPDRGFDLAVIRTCWDYTERAREFVEAIAAYEQGGMRVLNSSSTVAWNARKTYLRELGAAATQLRSRENNPLKFSPDVDAALSHLLGPAERGFLPPLQAVQEAFDDLRAHQVALLAGMRAALDSVMARFDPAALEQRMAPAGAWASLIPAQRKAQLWTEYSQQFAQIVGEVEGDFDALLGRAFLKAYQAQLAELARTPGA